MTNILIVEDNAVLRGLLREWLSTELPESSVLVAPSGEEALKCACAVPLSLAVMDIGLPGMNGIETARVLRLRYPELRVVMLSIHEEERYRQEACVAGVHAYVPKRNLQRQLLPAVREQLAAIKVPAPNADKIRSDKGEQGVAS
jgi:DNA-binding NarL/FixJ family response regulator